MGGGDYEGGKFKVGRGGGIVYDNDGKKVKNFKGDGGGDHMKNFIKGMRSRQMSDLHAPVLGGHRSACAFHAASACLAAGAEKSPGELKEQMAGDKESLDALERYSEQLAAWKVDLAKTPWASGVSLAFDPEKTCFTGSGPLVEKANAQLKRKYRAPFVVPEQV